MQDLNKKRSGKAGLPPGTLMHIGEEKAEKTKFTTVRYSEADFVISQTDDIYKICTKREHSAINWINVEGLNDVAALQRLGEYYKIHPLVLEDILTADQRPKIEIYDEYICIIVRMLYTSKISKQVSYEQISIILGPDYVVSFTESQSELFKPIYDRISNSADRIRKMGADYLAYSLLDFIVDNYFNILEIMDEKIEVAEENMVIRPTDDYLKTIHHIKRQLIIMHKSIWPLREVVSALDRGESPLIKDSLLIYIRDLHDHVIQIMDSVDTMRDIMSSLLDIYLSSVSKKMNEIMKVLTIISTIFIPLTFIVGVYGMNFRFMPELSLKWTYPLLWLIMAGIAAYMIYIFKKKKWW